jgi:hypothetical protein
MRVRQRLLMSLLAALLVAGLTAGAALARPGHPKRTGSHPKSGPAKHSHPKQPKSASPSLPEQRMNSALQLQGTTSNGVLSYSFDRTDITNVTLHGVPIKPSFEINGDMDFQPLGARQAFLNGDLPVPTDKVDATISTIIHSGLVFQAEHQHFYDFTPMVWFIHLRGRGNAVALAQKVHRVLQAAGTPLPQSSPSKPQTPFDVARLKQILHAYDASVGSDGVVTFFVARRNPIYIDGIRVNPSTNIATNIAFEPLNSSGTQAAAVPDFGMQAGEINRVVGTMQAQGWDIGCLYNQETAETPQLYFSHDFKTGDPYALAQQVRHALDQMNSQ